MNMNLRPLLLSLACVALALAAGCQSVVGGACHKPQVYAQAGNLPPLKVPAGLDGPDTSEAMQVPELTEPEVQLDPDGPCLEAPPAIVAPPLPPSELSLPERRPARQRGGDGPRQQGEQAGESTPDEEPRRRRRPPTRPR
jgi:hypothetical protein